jgi:hypothetical protein
MNYDELSLQSLEQLVDSSKGQYEQHHKTMIEALASIERRQLHKQTEQYRHTSFSEYIKSRFDLTYNAYQQSKVLYLQAPELPQVMGMGLARRAISRIGLSGAKRAVETAQRASKKGLESVSHNAIVRAVAEEEKKVFIERNKNKPSPVSTPNLKALVDKDKIILDLRAELAERVEQVEKLTRALADRDAKITRLQRQLALVRGTATPPDHGSHLTQTCLA